MAYPRPATLPAHDQPTPPPLGPEDGKYAVEEEEDVGNDDDAVVRHHAAEERTRLARDGKTCTTLIRACTNGNAWTVLAAATLVQACGGLAYSFAVYAQVGSTATSSVIACTGVPRASHIVSRSPFTASVHASSATCGHGAVPRAMSAIRDVSAAAHRAYIASAALSTCAV